MFCSECGKDLKGGAKFCPNCGSPVRRKAQAAQPTAAKPAGGPPTAGVAGAKKPPMKKKNIFLIAGICGAAAVVVILIAALGGPPDLSLGKTMTLANGVVPASGGEIQVSGSGTSLDGLVLTVPAGAYDADTGFEISATEIKSQSYGELFDAATPLITIDNGHGFANEPMTVKIPIEKTDGEFALAFFYDRQTGELEGIPFVEEDNESITIVTAHFSDIVVSKVETARLDSMTGRAKPERITGEPDSGYSIDSRFLPGADDFQMPNYGSVKYAGHCAGQSIAAITYYANRDKIGWNERLNGRYDNDGFEATPGFPWDDALEMRLCSAEQKNFYDRWTSFSTGKDKDTYYSFAYEIALTKNPQLIVILSSDSTSGHAMIIYKVTADALWVADPNFPGDRGRKIRYENGDLLSYFSGADAQAAATGSTEYTRFGYYGVFALVNEEKAKAPWLALMSGQDPGAGFFPADPVFQAGVGQNADGSILNRTLQDGLTVSSGDLAALGIGDALLIYPGNWQEGDEFEFYRGTQKIYTLESDFDLAKVPLQPGNNNIGILYKHMLEGEYRFVNFYRFNIVLKEGAEAPLPSLIVTPAETQTAAGEPVTLTAQAANAPADAVYLWYFGDGEGYMTQSAVESHAYADPGTYHGSVTLADAGGEEAYALAEFTVTVFAKDGGSLELTPTEGAQQGFAQWGDLLQNSGGVSEALYTEIPAYTPKEVGVTNSVNLPAGGTLRVTAGFASGMASGPRFYGDEFGYRAQAMLYIRYGGEVVKLIFNNGYDNEFDQIVQEIVIPSAQTVEIQIVPQGMTCYPETVTPASDGDGYYYASGQYTLSVDFLQAGN